jgi:hypothetical protein
MTYAGVPKRDPLSIIPVQQRTQLSERLALYVKANLDRNWEKLFDLVSRTGKGSVTRETFVVRMKSAHGTSFANSPDLVEFVPGRTFNGLGGGYDIYGCGKSQREGELYEGIAVVHAVYENGDWFFTGWRYVDLDANCKDLFDKRWEPENDMHWDRPMDEVIPIKDIGK